MKRKKLPPPKKIPQPQKNFKNYFFLISISPKIKKNDLKNFKKNVPHPPKKKLGHKKI